MLTTLPVLYGMTPHNGGLYSATDAEWQTCMWQMARLPPFLLVPFATNCSKSSMSMLTVEG